METLVASQVRDAPEHPVLPHAQEYDVREIRFWWQNEVAFLELEASTHNDYVVLHFEGVEELHVPCGQIITGVRLRIQDTAQCPSRTHRILPVRVGGTEEDGQSLQFWARSVMRIN